MVSDSENSFREAVDYLTANAQRNATIYYISTEDRQKIGGGQIDAEVFGWLLCFKGRCDIRIDKLDSEQSKDRFIVLLSNLDVYIFINEYKNLTTQVQVLKAIKNGESEAYILGMKE